jgi:hypothetical protein
MVTLQIQINILESLYMPITENAIRKSTNTKQKRLFLNHQNQKQEY